MNVSTHGLHSRSAPEEQVKLSVCLPVYNFAEFLGATLDSILPQLVPGVEVLVVDGASTDRTSDVVARRAAACPQLRYILLPRRGGIDADMAACVELARGDYCWLFSGDDVMRPGALARALACVASGDDVYLCKHSICDRNMRFLHEHPVFRSDAAHTTELNDPKARAAYLEAAVTTEALFSFMSGLVINRRSWRSEPPVEEFMGSCWGHVARLLALSRRRLRVRYVGEVWLDKRGDNDSFMDKGIVHRLRIAVDGFLRLATHFFGPQSSDAAQVRRILRNEIGLPLLLFARNRSEESPELESRAELDRMVDALFGGPNPRNLVMRSVYRFVPAFAYQLLRSAVRTARKALKSG
jgi:abequosyltransferase